MDIEKLIERLRTESLYADKASLEIMDLCMEAAAALATLQAENEKLRAELEQVKRERDAAQSLLAERIGATGAEPITTAFGLPLARIRELAEADREGRCVVLPCKIFDKVWDVIAHYQFEVTEIDLLPYGKIVFRCGNKGTDDYAAFYEDDLGDTFVLAEPPKRDKDVVKEAEAALRRDQDE